MCVSVCGRMLEEILRYIHSVARCVEENADKPTAKFWRVLLNKAYEVLDRVGLSMPLHISSADVKPPSL